MIRCFYCCESLLLTCQILWVLLVQPECSHSRERNEMFFCDTV